MVSIFRLDKEHPIHRLTTALLGIDGTYVNPSRSSIILDLTIFDQLMSDLKTALPW
jgi:hypothetical protein